MFKVNGRKIIIRTGIKSQTVNVCTTDNIHGVYESIVRVQQPFTTEETLRRAGFASPEQIIAFLQRNHFGKLEPPRKPQTLSARPINVSDNREIVPLTEMLMARDTHDLLVAMGLKQKFRVDVCSGIASQFPANTYEHALPVYAKQIDACFTDKARQIARVDLAVVDTDEGTVDLTLEFETDTNPKNLIGNYFSVFMADEYKSKAGLGEYKFDVTRTAHILLACLNPRKDCPIQQAALEKGTMVAAWLESVSVILAEKADLGKIRTAHAIAGDDWGKMKRTLTSLLNSTCPDLFETR
jgi:hypothetical protein